MLRKHTDVGWDIRFCVRDCSGKPAAGKPVRCRTCSGKPDPSEEAQQRSKGHAPMTYNLKQLCLDWEFLM